MPRLFRGFSSCGSLRRILNSEILRISVDWPGCIRSSGVIEDGIREAEFVGGSRLKKLLLKIEVPGDRALNGSSDMMNSNLEFTRILLGSTMSSWRLFFLGKFFSDAALFLPFLVKTVRRLSTESIAKNSLASNSLGSTFLKISILFLKASYFFFFNAICAAFGFACFFYMLSSRGFSRLTDL